MVSWQVRLGPVLRGDMDAEGAKTVSLVWIDTDKGDSDRPHCRSRLVVREIKRAMKKSNVLCAPELFSGMCLWKVLLSWGTVKTSFCGVPGRGERKART